MPLRRPEEAMGPEKRHRLEQVLSREQYAPRVPPKPLVYPTQNKPPSRQGPNVVSDYFIKKNCVERSKEFWKKPWGRMKVDLPLPSYLRDFKYADNDLLRPHFAHHRRNVGVGQNADASLRMLQTMSAPPYPSTQDSAPIMGCYETLKEPNGAAHSHSRLPMLAASQRVPLENPYLMEEVTGDKLSSYSPVTRKTRKKASPQKTAKFLDELTEAYALCSAHEQLAVEMSSLNSKTSKFGVSAPSMRSADGALTALQGILEKSRIKKR